MLELTLASEVGSLCLPGLMALDVLRDEKRGLCEVTATRLSKPEERARWIQPN